MKAAESKEIERTEERELPQGRGESLVAQLDSAVNQTEQLRDQQVQQQYRGYTRHAAIRPNKPTQSSGQFPFSVLAVAIPDKIDCPAAFFNALQAENFRFCLFGEISPAVQSGALPRAKAYPPFRSPYF